MTRMFTDQAAGAAIRHFVHPRLATMVERQAAAIGRQDAARPGARLRLFLLARPRLLSWVQRIFGFTVDNGLADERLERIRRDAMLAALAR